VGLTEPCVPPRWWLHEGELLQSIAEDKVKVKVKTLAGHTNYDMFVCEVGGMLASGSDDNTVKLWDVGSGTCVKTLAGHCVHFARCKDPICLRPNYSALPCYPLLNPVRKRQRRKAK